MSKEEAKKEKASQAESRAMHLAEAKDVAEEHVHPQKVLKIFSINIIAQGLPFCRRRVSVWSTGSNLEFLSISLWNALMSGVILTPQTHAGSGSLDMDVHIRTVMIDCCIAIVCQWYLVVCS